jgi:2-polyprenyl-6-hydroxyphenyl methylase/3-demethylubiquinone-9 3-methyltransferase
MVEEKPFSFGENWQSYLEDIDEERIAAARESLQRHFGVEDFSGSRFVDIGCGSGLFSLAALQLDAAEVISFDYDAGAVACAHELYQQAGEPDHWSLSQGNMPNDDFIDSLPEAEYVYAWGSVHYTGSLWEAIDNTLSLTASDGVAFMTIWNRVIARELSTEKLKSTDWDKIKYIYHHAPASIKRAMVQGYLYLWMLLQYKRGSSPAKKREKKTK